MRAARERGRQGCSPRPRPSPGQNQASPASQASVTPCSPPPRPLLPSLAGLLLKGVGTLFPGRPFTARELPHATLTPKALAAHVGVPRRRGTVRAGLHRRAWKCAPAHSIEALCSGKTGEGPSAHLPLNVSCSRIKAAPASSGFQDAAQLPHLPNRTSAMHTCPRDGGPGASPCPRDAWAGVSIHQRATLSRPHQTPGSRQVPGASGLPGVLGWGPGSPTTHPGMQVLPGGGVPHDEEHRAVSVNRGPLPRAEGPSRGGGVTSAPHPAEPTATSHGSTRSSDTRRQGWASCTLWALMERDHTEQDQGPGPHPARIQVLFLLQSCCLLCSAWPSPDGTL